ncbi:MAG: DUF3825 domain-containing protein [Peptoniphilaceae bacterium]|nr:DUF3825 domain-containing protein [Peptoniphilaceae bacterium]MDY6085572.1 DUF3825 domain-containing protein [Peptoniphilaceae bacterium]
MGKTGFKRIGYIHNYREYPQLIREKAGITYFNYPEFDAHIDLLWANKDKTDGIICYDANGESVSAESKQIVLFLIDTSFRTANRGEVIYAAFQHNVPGALDDYGWSGVTIGTKDELVMSSASVENSVSTLEQYTSIGNYHAIARVINESSGESLSDDECAEILKSSFDKAQSEGKLAVIENQYDTKKQLSFFPLVGRDLIEQADLFIKMEKNKYPNPKREWFGAFVISGKDLKEELLSFFCFHVGSFLFQSLSHANAFYNNLAEKAMRENWKWSDPSRNDSYDQPVLKSYLEFTYYRLADEDAEREESMKKIISLNGKIYFNSGLLDRNFRQIIIVGNEYILEKQIPGMGLCQWKLLSDVQAFSHNEHEIAKDFNEDELPAIASYFNDYRQVVFDARLDIHTNDHHIFEDGVARGRLPKYQEEYERVKDDDVERERLLTRIARDFDSAKERAKLMAERNYKLAVPQFFKETGEIQFLLPIYLGEREEAEKAHCALVLSLDTSGRRPYYRGETILTLDMAYNNARLIAKPDVFWLNDLV